MKRMICSPVVAVALLSGYNSSPQQSASRPQITATPIAVPVVASAPKSKPTFIKLHPRFHFVVKNLRVSRSTQKDTKEERVFFNAELGYKGPKPVWWGKRPQLSSLTFVTDTGKIYEARNVRQGEDFFSSKGLCVLYSLAYVPKLAKKVRVTKAVAVFEIENSGLAKITVNIPREHQRN